jgi:hypothetical protein
MQEIDESRVIAQRIEPWINSTKSPSRYTQSELVTSTPQFEEISLERQPH